MEGARWQQPPLGRPACGWCTGADTCTAAGRLAAHGLHFGALATGGLMWCSLGLDPSHAHGLASFQLWGGGVDTALWLDSPSQTGSMTRPPKSRKSNGGGSHTVRRRGGGCSRGHLGDGHGVGRGGEHLFGLILRGRARRQFGGRGRGREAGRQAGRF